MANTIRYYRRTGELPVLPLTPWMSLLTGVVLYAVHKLVFRNVDID